MRIQWLGTAAAEGWPAVFCECEACRLARELGGRNVRTRSSILIDGTLKVDLPPDTYHHVLTHGLNLAAVDTLLITHSHSDHLAPFELQMRTPPFAHLTDRPLRVFGNESAQRAVFGTVGERDRTFEYEVVEPFRWYDAGGDRQFMPLLADHDKAQECLIYIVATGGKVLLVGNDTGYFPEPTWEALEAALGSGVAGQSGDGHGRVSCHPLDAVSLDCTNGPLPGRNWHMGFDAICEVRERLLASGIAGEGTQFVATHFSHNGSLMHHEMESILGPRGFSVAYDGRVLEV